MLSKKMQALVSNNSVIRMMFEEGRNMAKQYGEENVYDFSLGNPNVPAPDKVRDVAVALLKDEDPLILHGYMNNAGYPDVRKKVADNLNMRFGTSFNENNIMMTVGAAAGLNCALKAIIDPGDEVLTFAPYFVEYKNYVANYDGVLNTVLTDHETFQPDLNALSKAVGERTKALIINSPNNPSGVIYSEETIRGIAEILESKQKEYGHDIFIISDEPYRELVYSDTPVPYVTKYYDNTMVCYSFSKTLSLPGERIGYLVIPDEAADHEDLFAAVTIANRVMGCVNAPSLFQKVVAECLDAKADTDFYKKNRDTIYEALISYGFKCVKPEGAFYLFIETPVDDREFVNEAKKEHILVVPGTSFALGGFVRLSYCVSYDTIVNSLPGFKRLAEHYGLRG